MELNYDLINYNYKVYNEARETIPAISQFEQGLLSESSMRSLSLVKFADFYNFTIHLQKSGFSHFMPGMSWKKLKSILIENTDNQRFKKFISNRTQKQFNTLLSDAESFDRFLNGRWVSRPHYTRRGRITSGRRSSECIEGLQKAAIPIINYVIQNNITTFSSFKKNDYKYVVDIKSFLQQEKYATLFKWFTIEKLSLESVPVREIEVTSKLLRAFDDILTHMKIDPRKLNLDYVTGSISENIKNKMNVPNGTNVRCLSDVYEHGKKLFTKDQTYTSRGTYISSGSIMIYLTNDLGGTQYVKYHYFEDMSIHRDNLLDDLFGK